MGAHRPTGGGYRRWLSPVSAAALVGILTLSMGASAMAEPVPNRPSVVTGDEFDAHKAEADARMDALESRIAALEGAEEPPVEEPPAEPVETDVEVSALAGNGSVIFNWNVTLGDDVDPATVDGVYVGRDGADTGGSGPWGILEPNLSGSRTFDKLVNGTVYTFEAELVVNGAPTGEVATVQATPQSAPGGEEPPPTEEPPSSGDVVPTGPTGNFDLAFQDEFDGASVGSQWNVHDGNITMNNVTPRASNVSVVNGELRLQLSDSSTGAMVSSSTVDGRGRVGFELPVGGVVEARINFPGANGQPHNWPAFWANADPWACGGEHDIAEVLGENGGSLTVNYHYGCWPNVVHDNQRPNPAGDWTNAFHTYTLHRLADRADVYWDGQLVHSYDTHDDGDGESIILNVGVGGGATVTGPNGALRVEYVRAWTPA